MPTMMRTIVRPLVTEKTSAAYQDRGEYTFEVHPDATKTTIKAAIESLFGVQFLPRDIYLISALPSDLRWPDVWRIGGMALALAFLATLYPSWRAARVRPADALRYE